MWLHYTKDTSIEFIVKKALSALALILSRQASPTLKVLNTKQNLN